MHHAAQRQRGGVRQGVVVRDVRLFNGGMLKGVIIAESCQRDWQDAHGDTVAGGTIAEFRL